MAFESATKRNRVNVQVGDISKFTKRIYIFATFLPIKFTQTHF